MASKRLLAEMCTRCWFYNREEAFFESINTIWSDDEQPMYRYFYAYRGILCDIDLMNDDDLIQAIYWNQQILVES
jgi:hypothetical protein